MSLEAIAETGTVRALDLTADDLQALLQHLIAARILNDRDLHGSYELRHDSLARKGWERMSACEKELLEIRQTIEIRYRDYRRRGLLLDADTLSYLAAYEDGLYLAAGPSGLHEGQPRGRGTETPKTPDPGLLDPDPGAAGGVGAGGPSLSEGERGGTAGG